jgi:hypothetical protein
MKRSRFPHKKTAVGLALSAVPVLALASPAAAADAEGNAHEVNSVDFDTGTEPLTCDITFGSQYRYDEETNTTWLRASNTLSGSDPECSSNPSVTRSFTESSLRINWVVNGQARASESAETDGYADHSLHIPIAGRPESVTVEHEVIWTTATGMSTVLLGETRPK